MTAGKGHNSGEAVAVDRLRSHVARIERLAEEKAALAADIREIYAEMKGDGFDTKIVRLLIRRRAQDRAELQEQDALLELYESGLGEGA
ncbi:MAG: GapR family DNA-binding domain-containing protein [Burkholderiaceae bacterium]